MDLLTTCINSWPFAGLLLGVVAIITFRRPLLNILERTSQVDVGGVKVSTPVQDQRQIGAKTDISKTEQVANAFQSPMLVEAEQVVVKVLDELAKNPAEREKVLVKHLAASEIFLVFERTYRVIFGSQLLALQFLSSVSNTLQDPKVLRPIYEQAKSKNSEFYASVSFEAWFSFLETTLLVARQDGKIGISIRGKEFLKYLIEQGYPSIKDF